MKDYSNPVVWAEFLEENHLPSDAPPPPKNFVASCPNNESLVQVLRTWAQTESPVAFGQRLMEQNAALDEALYENGILP